jgi:hypothetical protein
MSSSTPPRSDHIINRRQRIPLRRGFPTGQRACRTARRPRDLASRDQSGHAAEFLSGSGSGASGAQGASSERQARARRDPGRGAERRQLKETGPGTWGPGTQRSGAQASSFGETPRRRRRALAERRRPGPRGLTGKAKKCRQCPACGLRGDF